MNTKQHLQARHNFMSDDEAWQYGVELDTEPGTFFEWEGMNRLVEHGPDESGLMGWWSEEWESSDFDDLAQSEARLKTALENLVARKLIKDEGNDHMDEVTEALKYARS